MFHSLLLLLYHTVLCVNILTAFSIWSHDVTQKDVLRYVVCVNEGYSFCDAIKHDFLTADLSHKPALVNITCASVPFSPKNVKLML